MTPRPSPEAGPGQAGPGVIQVSRATDGRPAMPLPAHVRESLHIVLADLRLPALRWQVIAEGDAWGVSGTLRRALNLLPECSYASLDAIVDTLLHGRVLTARPPGGVPARPTAA